MAKQKSNWLKIFREFIKELRIQSKEVATNDPRGSELNLWRSQEIFLEEVAEGLEQGIRTFYVLKARQLGVTTISLAVTIFWMAVHPNILGVLVCDTEGNRDIFRSTIRRYINSIPKEFLGKAFGIVKGGDNRSFMSFTNGARLDFLVAGTTKKATWGEGRGYAFCHSTETSKYGDPKGLASFRETLAEQNPDRLFIYESTANGWGNHWHNMWKECQRDTLTKKGIFIGWWAKPLNVIPKKDPRYALYGIDPPDGEESTLINLVADKYNHLIQPEQLAWIRWRNSDEASTREDLDQNLPWTAEQAFILSGFSYFQPRYVQECLQRIYSEQIQFYGFRYWTGNDFWACKMERIEDENRMDEIELRQWEEPVKDALYIIGCDPAFGRNDNKDRHGINVYRCYADKLVQVAEYADNNVETRVCAWVLAHLAGAYKNCMVVLELSGGPGRAVMTEFNHLRDRLKADMYAKDVAPFGWEDFLSTARWYIYHRPDSMGSSGYVWNWETTWRNKFEIMSQLRDSYHSGLMIVNSVPLLEEMLVIVQDGSEIGAPNNGHDDRVMSTAFANRGWIEWIRPALIAQNYTYARITAEEQGKANSMHATVDRIVYSYFQTAEERSKAEPEPTYLSERGLE